MLRFGNISEIDVNTGYARVRFTDNEIVSDWLQVVVMGAISTKFFHTFDINEQVVCLMDENDEEGVIIGALYNNGTPPKDGDKDVVSVNFPDGSVISYNRDSHEYDIDIKGKVNITSTGETSIKAESVSLEAMTVDITAMTNITGNLVVSGSVTAASISAPVISAGGLGISGGNLTTTGTVTAEDVKSGAISLKTHKHLGVTTGSGTSGTPTP